MIDTTKPVLLGSTDLAAIVGNLESVASAMKAGLDSPVMSDLHSVFQKVKDNCERNLRILEHAQTGDYTAGREVGP